MRRILSMLREIRREQLRRDKLEEKRGAEVDAFFRELDQCLSAITPTSTNNHLREVMTSADFTYAIEEFVSRELVPGYERKVFNFEPLVKPRQNTNYLEHTDYQDRCGVDDLEYVGEKGQARPGSRQDEVKRAHQVYRWEKQYDFSHEARVNDYLQYFSDQAEKMGQKIGVNRTRNIFRSSYDYFLCIFLYINQAT